MNETTLENTTQNDMSAKQLVRIGMFYIEEAVSITLFQKYPEYTRAADLSRSIGIKPWDEYDWVIRYILRKMETVGRVEANYVNEQARGWKLTETEYNRLEGNGDE